MSLPPPPPKKKHIFMANAILLVTKKGMQGFLFHTYKAENTGLISELGMKVAIDIWINQSTNSLCIVKMYNNRKRKV